MYRLLYSGPDLQEPESEQRADPEATEAEEADLGWAVDTNADTTRAPGTW